MSCCCADLRLWDTLGGGVMPYRRGGGARELTGEVS